MKQYKTCFFQVCYEGQKEDIDSKLNVLAEKGWTVHSMTLSQGQGGSLQYMIYLMERDGKLANLE